MSALQAHRARLLAVLYEQFGEPADWTPVAGGSAVRVTIRRKGGDMSFGLGQAEVLAPRTGLKVRASEVAHPEEGDQVVILDPVTLQPVESFVLAAEPMRVKAGYEWMCDTAQLRTF